MRNEIWKDVKGYKPIYQNVAGGYIKKQMV